MSLKTGEACKATLHLNNRQYTYYSLAEAEHQLGVELSLLPKSLKILLESLLRFHDEKTVTQRDIDALVSWLTGGHAGCEIAWRPTRVLMQDFTGVPAVVDLAVMRETVSRLGGDARQVNPLSNVDLVIDHSVMVDHFGDSHAFEHNVSLEMSRNHERYTFLRWGQQAFDHFRVVPPGTGICHQVNLEYLGKTVWSQQNKDGEWTAFPDSLVGTDSHTTMINGLGVLGWGVGGIEAEAAMLGQPVSMLIPDVVGFELQGQLAEGITATDLVLTVTQMLRKHGVVGKFVEFYGDGLSELPLADRATIANMAPEYGATCGYFPVDDVTLDYLRLTGRDDEHVGLVEQYTKAQGLWREAGDKPRFTSTLHLNLADVEPSLAGPKRPQDRVALGDVPGAFKQACELSINHSESTNKQPEVTFNGDSFTLKDGAVVIAAITSCTNTSNPSVMLAAGLLAKNAVEKGLHRAPWVKASLAPGSKVVTDYLQAAGLMPWLEKLGFNLVGYGCTTCIGNSGPLPEPIEEGIKEGDLTVGAVLSGNRNFEGRIHPLVRTNWLASPPLVVAYALAGNMNCNLRHDPLGYGQDGKPVYLKDIWPGNEQISEAVSSVTSQLFRQEYAEVFTGTEAWREITVAGSETYPWQTDSTYIRRPPFFDDMQGGLTPQEPIVNARVLAVLGDSVTTDHISPAGNIKPESPAGLYLQQHGIQPTEFNSYGSRRGNHEVMMRGTFANIRIRNEMVPGKEGGITRHLPDGQTLSIYDAAMAYQAESVPLVVVAGKEYGSGSSRDWAAKGPRLLGVRAVIAESFERIHRSNLIGMGILPLEFPAGESRTSLGITGEELISIDGIDQIAPGSTVNVIFTRDGQHQKVDCLCRIDTSNEHEYYRNGGILHYVIRKMAGAV
ncbi:aconitate hydratase AcnA [Mangrovibacter yixingensis]|uniref:aconitate hydratase AcnA n=1 Tax=Mangrovibacter yixingensis TaxID=1529639 RepID=UPI001CFBF77E|nr:aconitate hydratase AcnA [Mangrovibacter yixingensis]